MLASPPPPSDTAATSATKASGDRLVPLTLIGDQMFTVMTHSLSILHFLYTHSVDATALNSMRKKLNGNQTLPSIINISPKITLLPVIMKALSQGCKEFRTLNCHLFTNKTSDPQSVIKESNNFGIAIDTPQGLLVPVVKDVKADRLLRLRLRSNA